MLLAALVSVAGVIDLRLVLAVAIPVVAGLAVATYGAAAVSARARRSS